MYSPISRPRLAQPSHSRSPDGLFVVALLLNATLLATGCDAQPARQTQRSSAKAEATQPLSPPASPATASEPKSYLERLSNAVEQASDAKDAIVQQLGDASQAGSDSAAESIDWATQTFNRLKEQGLTSASNTSEWLANDWSRAGAWEYKTLSLTDEQPIETRLNELGDDRWECFQIHHDPRGGMTFYLKRPVRSYLENLPMKDVMNLLPFIGAGKAISDR